MGAHRTRPRAARARASRQQPGLRRRREGAGFVREGTERGKFLIDGQRIDVETYGRLRADPAPEFDTLPLLIGL